MQSDQSSEIIQLPTPGEKGAVAVDWLSFTVPLTELGWAHEFFGPVELRKWGLRNYKMSGRLFCGGLIAWSPDNPKIRVYIELSARSLGYLRDHVDRVEDLIRGVYARGGRLTRIDFALDDVSGDLSTDRVYAAILNDSVRTRWRQITRRERCARTGELEKEGTKVLHQGFERIRSYDRNLKTEGDTVYLGRMRESDVFARVYDKTGQVIHALGFRAQDIPAKWCRLEVQVSRAKAEEVGRRIVRGDFDPRAFLIRYLDFLEPSELDRRHWPRTEWYSRIMGQGDRDRLTWPKYSKGLGERIQHFQDSLSGMLQLLCDIFGPEWVLDEIEKHGREKVQNNAEYKILAARHKDGRDVAGELEAADNRRRQRQALRDEIKAQAEKSEILADTFEELQTDSRDDVSAGPEL